MWLIRLPFQFTIDNKITDFKLEYNNVIITPIISKVTKLFEAIQVEIIEVVLEEELELMKKDFSKKMNFIQYTTRKAGVQASKFIRSYYQIVEKNKISQIYNGNDFITPYKMVIIDEQNIAIFGEIISNSGIRVITPNNLELIRKEILNDDKNIVDELFRMAYRFLENGFFEMAIMNLAMSLESAVKTFVFQHGIKTQDLNSQKGYVNKFYDVGLKLSKGKSLKEEQPEYFEAIETINDLRNEIAHGKHIREVLHFKSMSDEEIFDYLDDLLDYGEDILKWIRRE